MIEFKAWPKTPRMNRGMVVTEKIDGTNAAVIVLPVDPFNEYRQELLDGTAVAVSTSEGTMVVAAQSRKRLIKPGKTTDNAGFARWVRDNADVLAQTLGVGYHYGEWWGKGVQTGYGKSEKVFSLFNVNRYAGVANPAIGLDLVPILYEGPFSTSMVNGIVNGLRESGSIAVPGHQAEGVVVYHEAANCVFKVTCEGDDSWKGA